LGVAIEIREEKPPTFGDKGQRCGDDSTRRRFLLLAPADVDEEHDQV
jgi:hypothetical protein